MNNVLVAVILSAVTSLITVLVVSLMIAMSIVGIAYRFGEWDLSNHKGRVAIARASILIFSLAIIGSVSGFAAGLSRVGVVGQLVPSALTLLGGVVVYLFGAEERKGAFASLGAMAFIVALLVNLQAAAKWRESHDLFDKRVAYCTKLYSNADIYDSLSKFERVMAKNKKFCDPTLNYLAVGRY
jgi:hypothetical protein